MKDEYRKILKIEQLHTCKIIVLNLTYILNTFLSGGQIAEILFSEKSRVGRKNVAYLQKMRVLDSVGRQKKSIVDRDDFNFFAF